MRFGLDILRFVKYTVDNLYEEAVAWLAVCLRQKRIYKLKLRG